MFKARAMLLMVCVGFLLTAANGFAEDEAKSKLTPLQKLELIRSVADSQIKVEYLLKVDKGDSPKVAGMMRLCPSCGNYHPVAYGDSIIEEERPLEAPGFLIGPGLVQTTDIMVHPRFLEKIRVRFNDAVTEATIKSYSKDPSSVVLELSKPLAGAKPLTFNPDKEGPYYIISHDKLNGTWSSTITKMASKISTNELGQNYLYPDGNGIAITNDGTAVGLLMSSELPLDGSWKGDRKTSDWIDSDVMKTILAKTQAVADKCILRVNINLRSPNKKSMDSRRYMRDDEGEDQTEINTLAVITGSKQALVLANMNQKATARIERITIYTSSGQQIKATFAGTLSDYGALVVDLEKELTDTIKFAPKNILEYRRSLLSCASIAVKGRERIVYFNHGRISGYDVGWHNQVYPQLPNDRKGAFLFDEKGNLIAIPIARRMKVREDRWYRDDKKPLTSVAYVSNVLADLANNIDSSNVPLTEAQENRLAWLGIEMQALDRELARINNVSDQTNDGEKGGLVSYVYPDSPAAKADIQPGMVLIRLYVEDRAKPIEIDLRDEMSSMSDFPWDQLDMIPSEYLDQVPQPWGGAENSFTRSLTDIGFGKKFVAEFSSNGEIFKKNFTVVESPPHYDSAKRFKSAVLGVTVRNMTYEVRRYFQKLPEDPGVIVSKIESGEKAAVSGIKPYEIVTQVNGEIVNSVDDFERLVTNQQELRISLKRKMVGRVVKIKMDEVSTDKSEDSEE